ncbi:MAG: hypothetical protein D3925_01870 [Candidatus Electrothrix sp. AR5]|nr:hypothetical protein [Candidatus Electrothrix sp. AR5]
MIQSISGVTQQHTISFNKIFTFLSPKVFRECFINWVQDFAEIFLGQAISIDGKTLRRSHEMKSGKAAIYRVITY